MMACLENWRVTKKGESPTIREVVWGLMTLPFDGIKYYFNLLFGERR